MLKTLFFATAVSAVKLGTKAETIDADKITSALDAVKLDDFVSVLSANVASRKQDDYKKIVDAAKTLAGTITEVDKLAANKPADGFTDVTAVLAKIDALDAAAGTLVDELKKAEDKSAADGVKAHKEMKSQITEIHPHLRKVYKSLAALTKKIKPDQDFKDKDKNISALEKAAPKSKMWIIIALVVVGLAGVGAGAYFLLRKN